jgi:hypothetical protein
MINKTGNLQNYHLYPSLKKIKADLQKQVGFFIEKKLQNTLRNRLKSVFFA